MNGAADVGVCVATVGRRRTLVTPMDIYRLRGKGSSGVCRY